MKSGGHGQENIAFLRKKKLSYGIDTEFSNGVRLGHIDRHRDKRNTRKMVTLGFPENGAEMKSEKRVNTLRL